MTWLNKVGKKYNPKHKSVPYKLAPNKAAYFPVPMDTISGKSPRVYASPIVIPPKTERKKDDLGTFIFQKRKTGAKPMTMVPEMVVADKISGPKKIGTVPKIVSATIAQRPFERLMLTVLPKFKSTATNFEKEAKAESNVEDAEVIIMKFINNIMPTPMDLLTSTVA